MESKEEKRGWHTKRKGMRAGRGISKVEVNNERERKERRTKKGAKSENEKKGDERDRVVGGDGEDPGSPSARTELSQTRTKAWMKDEVATRVQRNGRLRRV